MKMWAGRSELRSALAPRNCIFEGQCGKERSVAMLKHCGSLDQLYCSRYGTCRMDESSMNCLRI